MGNENSRGRKSPNQINGSCGNSVNESKLERPLPSTISAVSGVLNQLQLENAKKTSITNYVKETVISGSSGDNDKDIRIKCEDDKQAKITVSMVTPIPLPPPEDKLVSEVDYPTDKNGYEDLADFLMEQCTVSEEKRVEPIFTDCRNGDANGDLYSQKINRFDAQQVNVGDIIGEGGFGRVFKATLNGATRVASKLILAPFVVTEELNSLLTLKHKNFVTVIGVVRQSSEMDPPQLLLQYYPEGNLLQYLNRHENPKDNGTLGKFAFDISEGCQFLHKCNAVHGNLAARNILVEKIAKNNKTYYNAKISDIGIIRFAEPSGVNYVKLPKVVPLRWVPKEIIDGSCADFTFSSDVWSFGVVLWEIWTKGAIPYGATYSNPRIIQFLNEGYSPLKVHRPAGCPKNIVGIMELTFQVDPVERPTFTELLTRLQHFKGHGTVAVKAGGDDDVQSSKKGKSSVVSGDLTEERQDLPSNLKNGNKPQGKKKEKAKKADATNPTTIPATILPSDAKVDNAYPKPKVEAGAKASKSNQKPGRLSEGDADSAAAEVEALRKRVAQLEKEKRGGGRGGGRGNFRSPQDKRGGAKPKYVRGAAGAGRGTNFAFRHSTGNSVGDAEDDIPAPPLMNAPPPYTEEPLPYHISPHLPPTLPSFEYGPEVGRGGYGGYFGRGRPTSRAESPLPVPGAGGKEEDTAAKIKRLEQEMALLKAEKRMQEATQLMKVASGENGMMNNVRNGFAPNVQLSHPMPLHQVGFHPDFEQYYSDEHGPFGHAPNAGGPGGHRGHRRGFGAGRSHQWRPYSKGRGGGKNRGRGGHNNDEQ